MGWMSSFSGVFRAVTRPRPLPHAAAELPPYRRKALLEALEPRLLLSADGLGGVPAANVLNLQLTDAADALVVRRVGVAADGGAILDVSNGDFFGRFGTDAAGIFGLTADGRGGDDVFDVADLGIQVELFGGDGNDTLVGWRADSVWLITSADAGTRGEQRFAGIENLAGAAGNQDRFVLTADGVVSGLIDGGDGGFDTLELAGGVFDHLVYETTGAQSGRLSRDALAVAFAGLKPVIDNSVVARRTVQLSDGGHEAVLTAGGTSFTLASPVGTFESITFGGPSESLTIRGGAGRDVFVFVSGGWPVNMYITDFTRGMDKIDVSDLGLSFADLSVSGSWATLDTLNINTSVAARLTQSDFVF